MDQVAGDATYCTLDDILPHEPLPNGCRNAANPAETGVLIGRPLPNVYTSVVDPALHPVPLGQAGELLVGGVGVAHGYHNRPGEMAHKFLRSVDASAVRGVDGGVHIPGMPTGRVVRTGDRVRQASVNGPFFWLGRLDSEVRNPRDTGFPKERRSRERVLCCYCRPSTHV